MLGDLPYFGETGRSNDVREVTIGDDATFHWEGAILRKNTFLLLKRNLIPHRTLRRITFGW